MKLRLLLLLPILQLPLSAQEAAEARLALLIGVGDYSGTRFQKLPGIDKDIARMKEALTKTGFTVTVLQDPGIVQAEDAVDQFGADLRAKKGVGLFYFSGHGGELEGQNYLIPKGARVGIPADFKVQALSAQRVLNRMESSGARVSLMFLDACRNDMTKAVSDTGLAPMNVKGTFIGFATASDKFSNASETGSPYTTVLAEMIQKPGLSVSDMHTLVNARVQDLTKDSPGGQQEPFQYSGLNSLFYFQPGTPPGTASVPAAMKREVPSIPVPVPAPQIESSSPAALKEASRLRPFVSSTGMRFIPVPDTKILGSVYETTRGEFAAFVSETRYEPVGEGTNVLAKTQRSVNWRNPGFTQADTHPVTGISEGDAWAYIRWLTQKDRKAGLIGKGDYYALPENPEWFAMLGAAGLPWGQGKPPKDAGNLCGTESPHGVTIAGYRDPFTTTSPAGRFPANENGFHDLVGNVAEMLGSGPEHRLIFSSDAGAAFQAREDSILDAVAYSYHRGGSFLQLGEWGQEVASRKKAVVGNSDVGFRCVLVYGGAPDAPIPDYFAASDQPPHHGSYTTTDAGAKVWNNDPRPGDRAEWTGRTDTRGHATHFGTLRWFKGNQLTTTYEGVMVRGRFEGKSISTDPDGTVSEIFWGNGEKRSR